MADDDTRLVYSTESGRVREARSRPAADGGDDDGVVRVARTKAGRKGKTVTLVSGLPTADRDAVARELKRLCGAGGAVREGVVEIQGEHRDRIVAHLSGRYRIKLAGG